MAICGTDMTMGGGGLLRASTDGISLSWYFNPIISQFFKRVITEN